MRTEKYRKLNDKLVNRYSFAFMLAIVGSLSALSFADTQTVGSEYGSATPGAATPQEIIANDAANVACEDNLCTLFSVKVNKKSFTVTSYVGTGMPMMPGAGNNYYYGSGTGTGTTGTNNGKLGYGLMITWDDTHCTKSVAVDKTVYDSVTTYMRDLVNRNPGEQATFPQFTPAEQTMILFYTTVMEQTKGSTCN